MKSVFTSLIVAISVATVMAADKPNVVLIFTDDLGYGDLGCYGAKHLRTPHIDSLARDGRKFTDAHSASAVCTPSRYALLTGNYPLRANSGKGVWGPGAKALLFDPDKPNIANVMKASGYSTAAIGKWHLGFGDGKGPYSWNPPLKYGPLRVGFDYYWGIPNVNSGPPYIYVENDSIVGYDPKDPLKAKGKPPTPTTTYPKEAGRKGPNRFGGAVKAHKIYDDEKTGTYMTEKAVKWIEENKENPFFLYFATTHIHHPFTPAPRFKGTSKCGLYGDFVHELDWMVGELLTCLEKNGLSDNTLVIFTSDNGGMLNYTGRLATKAGHKINGDLLGFKFGAWEGGHRVPFIARWPGKIKPGSESDQLICNVDMLATFTALTEQDTKILKDKDSVNILPALVGNPSEPLRDELVLAPHSSKHLALRKGKWIYIGGRGSGGFRGGKPSDHAWGGPPAIEFVGSVNSDIEDGQYKKDAPPAQLYNLENDLSQTKNIIGEHPKIAKEMKTVLDGYRGKKASPTKNKKKPTVTAAKIRPSAPANAPNVIFMLTDDLGYSDIGCYGAKTVKTPHIDRLAKAGFKFTNFHTGASICSPSRAAFLTGGYPQRAGLYMGINPNRTAHWFLGLHPDEITLAEQFQTRGYATHMVGKWHLGTEPEFLPRKQGFDTYYGMPCNFSHSPQFLDGDEVVFEKTPLARLTKLYTERVTQIIRESSERKEPFFLYYAHNYPHTPYQASPQFKGSSKGGVRGDMMQEMDWGVGEMMKAIKEAGVADNTIVIFTSDNGPTSNAFAKPYRGTKYVTFEGGHRVPFIVHWPKTIKEGKVSDIDIHAMDLFPTLSEIVGAPLPKNRVYDGESLMPVLNGGTLKREKTEPFYYYNCENLQAVRQGEWKLHLPRTKAQLPFWDKNKVFTNIKHPVLYNLKTDHAETSDVADKHPEVVQKLLGLASTARGQLGEFMKRGEAQRPTGSLFPDVPVISHEKDWGTIEPVTAKAIAKERMKRHPDAIKPRRKKK